MEIQLSAFASLGLVDLFFGPMVSAQDLETGVTYVCNGERLVIEGCDIRDLSDSAKRTVGHRDTILPNGLMKYTAETRGDLKKLLPACN